MTKLIKENPIGIFDSGIGGLTVVKKIDSFLPNEHFIYFGDTARVPYGSKSNSTVIDYSIQNTKFLLKKNVKMVIVACNTASSVAIPSLEKNFHLPIIDMIEPGTRMAIEKTITGRIGVIGTYATINNKAYSKELLKLDSNLEIFEKPCPLFVPLAEEGLIDHPATKLIAEEYLKELRDLKIDTLILGCTHYPILAKVIQETIGSDVALIDSGVAASILVEKYLKELNLSNDTEFRKPNEFYVSDVPNKFKEVAELFLGKPVKNLTKIDLEELTG